MYSQRTRNIIIGSVITTVIVVVALILGITLYTMTDLFKSNDTLFYKYAAQSLDSLKYVQNSQLTEIEKLKDEKTYKVDGKFRYESSDLYANSINGHI